jgi:asparagine synthase (glutamine-hydrolysing)
MGKKRVFAARDRVGIKPLYMSRNAGGMWLSSELRTIVGVAGISPTLRPASVHEFLAYSYPLDQRHTPVEEVERLLPGEYLLIDSAGMTLKRYWEPHFGGDEGIAEISDGELLEILQTAMQIHLRSDVPVGILLSGGLDSSTVAAMASRAGTNYTAISAGYSGHHAVDERREARATARKFGLNFIEIENKLSLFDSYFEELVRYCDEPVGDIAAMAQWGLYRQARHLGFKVLLSGVGGDEVMFGYPQWNDWGEALRSMGGDADSRARFITEKLTHNLGGDTGQVATGPLAAAAGEAHHAVRKLFEKAPQGPDQIAALVFGTYLVQNGCQLADKLGMGCSMEVRVPLLDHAFIESVFQLPLVRRFERGRSKPLLRRLMRGTLPDVLLEAPKRGFAPPTDFIVDITNKKADVLLDGKLARSGWVDTAILERMVQKGRNLPWLKVPRVRRAFGIEQAPWFLFRLIAFERWFENVTSPSTIVGPLA